MKKCDDWYLGLLAYRNTELPCGSTPAKLLFGRNLREVLPMKSSKLKPALPNHHQIQEKQKVEQEKSKMNYDRRHRTKYLPELSENNMVWIRDMSRSGCITGQAKEPNSYWVDTEEGPLRRNRKFLSKLPELEGNNKEDDNIVTSDNSGGNSSGNGKSEKKSIVSEESEGMKENEKRRNVRRPKKYDDYVC